MIKIGIINIGISNIKSVHSALDYLGYDLKLISCKNDFESISHLILPGVGSFPSAMSELEKSNLISPIMNFTILEKIYWEFV